MAGSERPLSTIPWPTQRPHKGATVNYSFSIHNLGLESSVPSYQSHAQEYLHVSVAPKGVYSPTAWALKTRCCQHSTPLSPDKCCYKLHVPPQGPKLTQPSPPSLSSPSPLPPSFPPSLPLPLPTTTYTPRLTPPPPLPPHILSLILLSSLSPCPTQPIPHFPLHSH